jgi:hypothetical protein
MYEYGSTCFDARLFFGLEYKDGLGSDRENAGGGAVQIGDVMQMMTF